jgi:hypothetical protein
LRSETQNFLEETRDVTAKIQSINGNGASSDRDSVIDSARTLGALSAVGRLGTGLAAQAFHELETWLSEKRYRELGFSSEVDFLNSPLSPISKNRYFDRKQLLEKEGAQTFDLLNSLRVPISARKLLSDGSVKLNDDVIEIGEEKINVTDRARVMELIQTLAAKDSEQARTIERGRKELNKKKDEIVELKEALSQGGTASADVAPHARALVLVLGDLQLLTQEVTSLTNRKELKRFAPIAMQRIAEAKGQLEAAFGFKAPKGSLELSADDAQGLIDAED